MFVHSVYFWLKKDLTYSQHQEFRKGAESLLGVDSVECGFVGTPARTDRPIIDRSYTFALTVVFQDQAGHDAYQVDPLHLAFVDRFGSWWDKVLIYDAE